MNDTLARNFHHGVLKVLPEIQKLHQNYLTRVCTFEYYNIYIYMTINTNKKTEYKSFHATNIRTFEIF